MMKGFKRLMAAFLAVAIMFSAAPVMKTEAAGRQIKGYFVDWLSGTATVSGATTKVYDCTTSYVGIDSSYRVSDFEYAVYTQDGSRQLRKGTQSGYYSKGGKKCVLVKGGRKTVLTSVRIRAKIDGKWSAWTGLIGLIPIHTDEHIYMSFNKSTKAVTLSWGKFTGMTDYELWVSKTGKDGWKMLTRTTGNSYTFSSFNGQKFVNYQYYYYKVVGRAKVGSVMTKAKGDSSTYFANAFYIYTTYK